MDKRNIIDLTQALYDIMLKTTWSDGYDRNGSHESGNYVEYKASLDTLTSPNQASAAAHHMSQKVVEFLVLAGFNNTKPDQDLNSMLENSYDVEPDSEYLPEIVINLDSMGKMDVSVPQGNRVQINVPVGSIHVSVEVV
jgi:hypothetical protein